jgi:heme/copper-type cytochrome/quinol oxidase subunit 1
MDEKQDKAGHLNAVIFTTSVLLFLMITGAGIALFHMRLSELVQRGEASTTTLWAASIGGVIVGLGLAIFVAHIAISFLELVARNAARGSTPSDPAPPRPKKRSLRLVA